MIIVKLKAVNNKQPFHFYLFFLSNKNLYINDTHSKLLFTPGRTVMASIMMSYQLLYLPSLSNIPDNRIFSDIYGIKISNPIKIKSLTCSYWLIRRCMRDLRKPHYRSCVTDLMYHPMKMAIAKIWKILLIFFPCYEQSDWLKKVITVFIILSYIHAMRSFTRDP